MIVNQIKVGNLKTNCYIITIDDTAIIIDPGDDIEKIKEQTKDLNIIAILITHYHFDHVGALSYFKNIKIFDYKNEKIEYKIKNFKFKIIETKGHTTDSVSFYFEKEKTMFVGDFVFKGTIGRTDLATSNENDIKKNIEKLKTYPKETKIYPGHGIPTTLNYEIENNPFF